MIRQSHVYFPQVDSQGIPREAEMWNKVQRTLASQQSQVLLRDQLRACFQELQSGNLNYFNSFLI